MGYEYRILKPKDNTWFDMGKGDFTKPLESFAKWDREAFENAKDNNAQLLAQKLDFKRSMMAENSEDFVGLYKVGLGEYASNSEEEYVEDLAKKLWNWLAEDDVWIYGDHAFEVHEYNNWFETGSRYGVKCGKCRKELTQFKTIHHKNPINKYYCITEHLCDECFVERKNKEVAGLVLKSLQRTKTFKLHNADEILLKHGWERPKHIEAIFDAHHMYKDGMTATIGDLSEWVSIRYTVNVYRTVQELEQEEAVRLAEIARQDAHNEKYKDTPGVPTYVRVPTFEIVSKPVVPWSQLKLKRFNVVDRAAERAKEAMQIHTGIFIDGIGQK